MFNLARNKRRLRFKVRINNKVRNNYVGVLLKIKYILQLYWKKILDNIGIEKKNICLENTTFL